jgi:hypothetical protein
MWSDEEIEAAAEVVDDGDETWVGDAVWESSSGVSRRAAARLIARAALNAIPRWRPIESAPKDGRFVLLHVPNDQLESGAVTVGAYYKPEERAEDGKFLKGHWDGWLGMDADVLSSWCEPTHWMPLPEPPTDD